LTDHRWDGCCIGQEGKPFHYIILAILKIQSRYKNNIIKPTQKGYSMSASLAKFRERFKLKKPGFLDMAVLALQMKTTPRTPEGAKVFIHRLFESLGANVEEVRRLALEMPEEERKEFQEILSMRFESSIPNLLHAFDDNPAFQQHLLAASRNLCSYVTGK
jgi:hypothetical protein